MSSRRPEPEQFETFEQYCTDLLRWNIETLGGQIPTDEQIRERYRIVSELGPVEFESFVSEPKDLPLLDPEQ